MISNIGSFPESGVKRWTREEVIAKLQEPSRSPRVKSKVLEEEQEGSKALA